MANNYIRLRIAKTTAYKGRVLVPGEELLVNAKTADLLIERKLAEAIGEHIEDDVKDEFDDMTIEELKEYAQEAGIDLKDVTEEVDIIAAIRKAM